MNSTSLAVNEQSYFILSAHHPVIFIGVYDAPFELVDEGIVKTPMSSMRIVIAISDQTFPT